MIKRMHLVSLLVGLIWVSSCSRMIVNVSTADLEVVEVEAEKVRNRTDAYYYASVKGVFFDNYLFDANRIKEDWRKCIQEATSNGNIDENDIEDFIKIFDKNLKLRTSEIRTIYENGLLQTRAKNFDEAIKSYLTIIIKSNELKKLVQKEFEAFEDYDCLTNFANNLFDRIDLLKYIIQTAPEGDKDNLLGDPMVSYITKTENSHIWKSNYNKTKSWTSLGNSDIAVVLTEDPESYNNNYTIKGVRVDADKLIQSSFDGLAQSINVLASSQGISVPEDNKNNYFAPSVNPAIQKLPEDESALKKHQKVLSEYKKFILMEILGRDLDNKSGPELKKSIEEIQTVWNTYKTKMETRNKQVKSWNLMLVIVLKILLGKSIQMEM